MQSMSPSRINAYFSIMMISLLMGHGLLTMGETNASAVVAAWVLVMMGDLLKTTATVHENSGTAAVVAFLFSAACAALATLLAGQFHAVLWVSTMTFVHRVFLVLAFLEVVDMAVVLMRSVDLGGHDAADRTTIDRLPYTLAETIAAAVPLMMLTLACLLGFYVLRHQAHAIMASGASLQIEGWLRNFVMTMATAILVLAAIAGRIALVRRTRKKVPMSPLFAP